MKIKVNKAKLIAAIQAKAKAMEAEYKKELAGYEETCKKVKQEWIDHLSEKLAEIKANHFDPKYGPSYRFSSWPQKPPKPRAGEMMESLLNKLNLVDGEVIYVDDKSDYFSFI